MTRGLVIVAALAAHAAAAPVNATAVLDRPVAIVGDDAVWESQVQLRLHHREARERAAIIDEIVDELLWLRQARKLHLQIDDAEVQAAFEEIKQQNKLDNAGIDKVLVQEGYSRAAYMVDLANQLQILRAKNLVINAKVVVTDADLEAAARAKNLTLPLADADKETLRRELRGKRADELTARWLAGERKRVRIEKR